MQGVDLSFVIRRERTLVRDAKALRHLARSLTRLLYHVQYHTTTGPAIPQSDDLGDMVFAGQAAGIRLTPQQQALLRQVLTAAGGRGLGDRPGLHRPLAAGG